jgi:hypothetical protein
MHNMKFIHKPQTHRRDFSKSTGMGAQHKLGDEFVVYHPRLQIDNLLTIICMRMYIF